MDENARVHRSRQVMKIFSELGIQTVNWSPDLDPIQNIRASIKRINLSSLPIILPVLINWLQLAVSAKQDPFLHSSWFNILIRSLFALFEALRNIGKHQEHFVAENISCVEWL